MTSSNSELISDLIQRSHTLVAQIKKLSLGLNEEALNWKPSPTSWSVLECLEHLNLYGDFYIPEIKRVLKTAKATEGKGTFKSGWLGNYFAKMMLPKAGKIANPMKTFKDKNPSNSHLPHNVMDRFFDQQEAYLELLKASQKVNLSKTKTGISISSWIKLRLGDTWRVVVYHNQRHTVQVEKVIQMMKSQSQKVLPKS